MTLPQATALQIDSRQPTAAEILAYAARRKDKWFSPPAASRKSTTASEPVITRVYMTEPVERVWARHYDSHMAAYYEWKGNEPLGFLKLRCREMELNFDDIIGGSLKRIHTVPRGLLMVDVRIEYPDLSLPQIGRLFDRDHTSCLAALRKHGLMAKRDIISRRTAGIETAKAMFADGRTYRQIGDTIGISATTVNEIIKENGWVRDTPARSLESRINDIRQLFDEGKSLTGIAKAVGRSREAVRIFIKRQGWQR